MKTGINLIEEERKEQLYKHEISIDADMLNNKDYQLSKAATVLATYDPSEWDSPEDCQPEGWDRFLWERAYHKPYKERLIIAGALIAAEIDRLQYENK